MWSTTSATARLFDGRTAFNDQLTPTPAARWGTRLPVNQSAFTVGLNNNVFNEFCDCSSCYGIFSSAGDKSDDAKLVAAFQIASANASDSQLAL